MSKINEKVYSEQEIEAKLIAELPNWIFENNWIRRKYKTSGWKGTMMVVNTVGHLAEAAWHHPDYKPEQGKIRGLLRHDDDLGKIHDHLMATLYPAMNRLLGLNSQTDDLGQK